MMKNLTKIQNLKVTGIVHQNHTLIIKVKLPKIKIKQNYS